jgi:L-ascorbate metabolism protein UlaG (beta-lactamase superfamily)
MVLRVVNRNWAKRSVAKSQDHCTIYFSGDAVWYEGVAEIGRRFRLGTCPDQSRRVQVDSYGPERLTMSADKAVQLARACDTHTLIPLHYEGWVQYRKSREKLKKTFTSAGLDEYVRWLAPRSKQENLLKPTH